MKPSQIFDVPSKAVREALVHQEGNEKLHFTCTSVDCPERTGGKCWNDPTEAKGEWEEKARIDSEVAIFWDLMSQNLPKSIERAALGDEKIYLAFRITYPEIRKYFASERTKAEEYYKVKGEKNRLIMMTEDRLRTRLVKAVERIRELTIDPIAFDTIVAIIKHTK